MTEPLGLYIHIPFCVRKCRYCDFLSFPTDTEHMELYTGALCRELRALSTVWKDPVDTVFIGGGTPSVLPYPLFRKILETVYGCFAVAPEAEVTTEMNPGAVWTEAQLASLLASEGGKPPLLNRVSLGMQSAHDSELKRLGRIHDFHALQETYGRLRAAGAANLNLDLMFGIPGQSPDSWRQTLEAAVSLKPEHISAYSLIVEEGTTFYTEWESGELLLPGEETERKMAHEAAVFLKKYGYRQYEISNYAKEGYESRHNLRYWQRKPYLGAGLGAASFARGTRWNDPASMEEYLRIWTEQNRTDEECLLLSRREEISLTVQEEMEEFFFLGLRMTDGVSEAAFQKQFGRTPEEEYGPVLEKYRQAGLLEVRDGRIYLNDKGMDVSNVIMSDFLHED